MALINITNIIVENNPCSFLAPFLFKITFECAKEIKEGVDWKLIYVGSSKDDKYDQILDSFSMDDLQAGVLQFQLQVNIYYIYFILNRKKYFYYCVVFLFLFSVQFFFPPLS